jgi:hypothetical protein
MINHWSGRLLAGGVHRFAFLLSPAQLVALAVFAGAAMLRAQPSTSGPACLDYWPFTDTNTWTTALGYAPVSYTNLGVSYLGAGTALVVDSTSPASVQFNTVESDGTTNLMEETGSWTFWIMPSWSSASAGGSGPW